ncbi:MAG TPA: Crp/Fnr family transcriptional regulator [Patescibacteria group bacterium]|nr:Crp/Fnr family transcriptional regulator [Patescibacteria group bacterium]
MTDEAPIPWTAVPLFQSLSQSERAHLLPLIRISSAEPGQVIFREGDPALMFHFITEGQVKIVKSAANGKDVLLEIFGPGDPVGAVAAYEERDFPASAVALETTRLVSVPRGELFMLLAANPLLSRGLLLGLTRRMLDLTRKLSERSSRAEYRVARLFLALSDRFGTTDGTGISLPMALTRQEIADMVGMTQETVIRIMSRWGKSGILETVGNGFILRDRAALERIPPGDSQDRSRTGGG